MTRDYIEKRIYEALKLTGGNATKARSLIIQWTQEDSKLLRGLAHPHLTGIVAHAISRVQNKKDEPVAVPVPDPESDPEHQFGLEILKAIAGGGAARFGMEESGPPARKQPASQRHIDAIRQMAGKKGDTTKK